MLNKHRGLLQLLTLECFANPFFRGIASEVEDHHSANLGNQNISSLTNLEGAIKRCILFNPQLKGVTRQECHLA